MDEALRKLSLQGGDAAPGLAVALKIASNVLAHLDDDKYRRLKSSSAALRKLLALEGGVELLLALGFEADGDEFHLPASASPVRLLQARNAIESTHRALTAPPAAATPASAPSPRPASSPPQAPAAPPPTAAPPAPPELMEVDAPPAPDDAEEELQAALALSMENDGRRTPPPSDRQALFQARVKELFAQLTASGIAPNEAAARALEQATSEAAGKEAPAEASVLTKEGFTARVKQLFGEAVATGLSANEAAASAMQQAQAEQLKAASAERVARQAAPPPEAAPPSLAKEPSEASVSFKRWEEIEKVAQAQVDEINLLYRTDGVTFVDPSFPPTDRSLYASHESATSWMCRGCHKRNPLPPQPSEQELVRLLTDRSMQERQIACAHCRTEHQLLETAMRPCGWQRPAYLRDDITLQYSTVPWVVVRDEPRPDDIRQGTVGNCWLVCAMSSLAENPENIRRILITKEYNPAGAYQVRLCRAGEWHCVLIDDVFPTNGLSCLAYLKAARRSLWGPLIEKAAAKLHGSYEALNGGSFAEAFGMLTGCPVQRIILSRYRPPADPPAGATPEALATHAKRLERWRSKKLDFETLYAQLYSFKEAGFVIGASTFFGAGASTSGGTSAEYADLIQEARNKGLQFPHAYSILALAEVDGEPLVKLRNPNGHAGWRGEWGKGSSRWTYELKQQLGIEREDSGVFWMAWPDLCRLFAELTVCRLLHHHLEARQGGWLPSVFGLGQALTVEVFAHSHVELALHQEPHSDRGEKGIQTLIDVGFAVMKQQSDGSLSLVTAAERSLQASVCASATLEQDDFVSKYLVLPLCFGHLRSAEPRKFTLSCHSTMPITLDPIAAPPKILAAAAIQIVMKEGDGQSLLTHPVLGAMLKLWTMEDEGGYMIVAENMSQVHIRVEVDASEHTSGFLASRGALFCQDVLPPRSRQLLLVLSIDLTKKSHSLSMAYGGGVLQPAEVASLGGGGHIPALEDLGALRELHEPQPMGRPAADAPMEEAMPPGAQPSVDISALTKNILNAMQQQRHGQPER